jgi:hypothetical protein
MLLLQSEACATGTAIAENVLKAEVRRQKAEVEPTVLLPSAFCLLPSDL